jgi:hypothetical protein
MSESVCRDCGRRYVAYPGEIRTVCWLCWIARFPTPQARAAELQRRGMGSVEHADLEGAADV